MPYRVIQWATGNVGRAAVEGILAHPDLELVGAYVTSDAKNGRDVGEICNLGPIGVRATTDVDAILALDADCVLYSPLLGQVDEVLRLLRAGKNVVTPVGWFYPFRSPDVDRLQRACAEGHTTLHGTGMHPGGFTERFPLMLSAMCMHVRHVRAEEFSDIRNYPTASVVRDVMMFGTPPEAAQTSPMPMILGLGFCESIDMIADWAPITLRSAIWVP